MEMQNNMFSSWCMNFILKIPTHVLKRVFQKIFLWHRKKTNGDYYTPRSKYEGVAIRICRNIVQNKNTLLEMSPSGERYATNDELGIIYFIYETSVDIIKDNISREIVICPKTRDIILNIFDGHVKLRRDAKKERVFSNLKSTLENIEVETKINLSKWG